MVLDSYSLYDIVLSLSCIEFPLHCESSTAICIHNIIWVLKSIRNGSRLPMLGWEEI